jgi:hypothetical protein
VTISERRIHSCKFCGADIAWHRNRHGESYPVDVFKDPSLGIVYQTAMGAHRNLTP